MRIFVYEHLTARASLKDWPLSVVMEGRAMLSRVAADLASLPGIRVTTSVHPEQELLDLPGVSMWTRQGGLHEGLAEAARNHDRVLLIAPEIGGLLAELAGVVEGAGGTLLGPSAGEIRRLSDKLAIAEMLGSQGIPTYPIAELPAGMESVVVKPQVGAGGIHTYFCQREQVDAIVAHIRNSGYSGSLIAQPVCPGLAMSVAVIGGAEGKIILPAGLQRIEKEPMGVAGIDSHGPTVVGPVYRGGSIPGPSDLQERARRLVETLFTDRWPLGYVGVDLIMGADPQGNEDRICDVNPRVTTAYIGYSALFGSAIAHALVTGIAHASAFQVPTSFAPVDFDANGQIRSAENLFPFSP